MREPKARKKLGQILIDAGVIQRSDFEKALSEQQHSTKKLGEMLLEKGICSEDDIAAAILHYTDTITYLVFSFRADGFFEQLRYVYLNHSPPNPYHNRIPYYTHSPMITANLRISIHLYFGHW